MALRVLLADESSTIKKVIQLSLQDFQVDVKSVTVGIDVLSVAKTYRPDVILADVLLAKRSGYEVCHDIKSDPETNQIPVVLMWSGFMEIDEQKARLCGADRRLEKPFDASMLRQIVQELVSRSQNNPVSSFLQFPSLPPFEEPQKPLATPKMPPPPVMGSPKIPVQTSVEDDDALIIDDSDSPDDEWVQQPIVTKPAAPPSSKPAAPPTFPLNSKNEQTTNLKDDEFTEFPLTAAPKPSTPKQAAPMAAAPQPSPQMVKQVQQSAAPQASEEMVREEIQKWLAKNMPDIAERLIRDEINRLLQESEKTIQGP